MYILNRLLVSLSNKGHKYFSGMPNICKTSKSSDNCEICMIIENTNNTKSFNVKVGAGVRVSRKY